jgi:multiple sugar transport system permease protein
MTLGGTVTTVTGVEDSAVMTALSRSKPRKSRWGSNTPTGLTMAAPAVIGILVFVAVPFIYAIYLSFTNARLGSAYAPEFVGLRNYRRILDNPDFWTALRNNGIFAVVVVPLQTAMALGIALLLNRPLRGMALFRTFFFMPVVFPMALVSVVWLLLFAPGDTGAVNSLLSTVTFGAWQPVDFLNDSSWAMPAIILVSIWQGVGFQMVIILAGLQGIPATLYEAASIDKANAWNQFRNVTLPQLRNTLIFVVMVTTILSFRLFDQVQIMTPNGGPNQSTETVMFLAVSQAFGKGNIGLGAATTVLFFLIVLTLTLVQRGVLRQEREVD